MFQLSNYFQALSPWQYDNFMQDFWHWYKDCDSVYRDTREPVFKTTQQKSN